MKGFEITFRGKTINVAPEFDAGAFIYQRNGYFHADVSGLEEKSDGKMLSHKWIDSNLELGGCLEIEIKEIDKTSETIETKIAFSTISLLTEKELQDMFIEKIKLFNTLEKLLKDEGFI
jgi:hypothetical protein